MIRALLTRMVCRVFGGRYPRLTHLHLSTAQMRGVTEYMDAHLADRLRIADLAAVCGVSAFHFIRAFKATAGLTPHQYLTARRIERAQALLRGGCTTVKAAAASVGYGSPPHFRTAFRRYLGSDPSMAIPGRA